MRPALAILPFIFSLGLLPAQTLNGPIEGFIFDTPTKSLRGIRGFLGSASLGPAIDIGSSLDYASVAPYRNYAIAFQEGRCLLVSGLDAEHATTVTLPGSFSVPEGVVWSGDGSLAVLYSATGKWVQTISGLPASPNPGASLDVSPLGGALSAVAADLHGARVAVAIAGENGGVFQIAGSGDQMFLPLFSASKPISLAFTGEGEKLHILDGGSNQLSELNLADSTSQTWQIAELANPVAVRSARDGAQRPVIYVAGGSDRSLLVYDASSHEPIASVPLGFEPTEIQLLGRNSYLLRSRASKDDPLWSFKNSPQPMVYFVPATPLTAGEDATR